MLFIVSGPSGAGKSSLCGILLERFPRLAMSVSCTTRAARGAERDGEHYHFVSTERFAQLAGAGAFAEHAEVHGNRYGTLRGVIEDLEGAGRDVLFDIDYQGAAQLRAAYPSALSVMILPPSLDVLRSRLERRATDLPEVVARRMAKAAEEMAHAPEFDFVLVNRDLAESAAVLGAIYVSAPHAAVRSAHAALAELGISASPR